MHRHFFRVSKEVDNAYMFRCVCGELYEFWCWEYWKIEPRSWRYASMYHYVPSNRGGIKVTHPSTVIEKNFFHRMRDYFRG